MFPVNVSVCRLNLMTDNLTRFDMGVKSAMFLSAMFLACHDDWVAQIVMQPTMRSDKIFCNQFISGGVKQLQPVAYTFHYTLLETGMPCKQTVDHQVGKTYFVRSR